MTRSPSFGPVIGVGTLARGSARTVSVTADAEARKAIAAALDLVDLRKLSLVGQLLPIGKADWRLEADLGATVVQACVVTLAPVVTRIEEPVSRRWVAGWDAPQGDEVEIPEEVDDEPLGAEIDLGQVMVEALALELPPFPRAEGADLGDATFAGPGVRPMSDDDAKPFAGLAALRDKLAGGDGGDDDGEA